MRLLKHRGRSKSSGQVAAVYRAIVVALVAVVPLLGDAVSASSAPNSPRALVKDLLTSSYAKAIGFSRVVTKASTTATSGVKNCPDGGHESFESASGQTGLLSEVLLCTTNKTALAVLNGTRAATSASSVG